MTKKQNKMWGGLIGWTGPSLARSDAGRDTGIHLEDEKRRFSVGAVFFLALAMMSTADAATTNAVPWSDSFETYPNGTVISGTAGWSGPVGGAVVTNDAVVTGLLPDYPVGGKTYPLATTHTNVLKITDETHSALRSISNGLVIVEFMVYPSWVDTPPAGDLGMQCNFCVSTNARLTVWHHNVTGATNEWLELTNSPAIATNAWARFTIVADYATAMFQIRVNEADPITDSTGWTAAAGGNPSGPWFHMVQTNGLLAGIRADGSPAYLDDVVVTNLNTPSLSWSTNAFGEAMANDGTLDNSAPLLINLTSGTFNGTPGDDFATNSAKLMFSNLPAGLTGEAILMSSTQVRLRFLGNATAHAVVNNLSNVGVVFHDAAFVTLLNWSVLNVSSNLSVTFMDPGTLTYATNVFTETAANSGAVSGTTLSLAFKTFNATNGENLVASGKVTGANVPGGLTLQVVVTDSQHVTLSLAGNAASHAAANNISNLGVTFTDAAFTGGNATGVANATRSNLQVQFSNQPVVAASPAAFVEAGANNGTMGNTVTITLTGDSFTNAAFVSNTQYTVANVPAGLTFSLTYADATHVTAALAGTATSHTAADTIANLGVTFLDAAFTTVAATHITGHPFNLNVTYANAPVLTYSTNVFTEISGGVIDNRNPVAITLSGDAFGGANGQDFVAAGWLTVANLPAGLTALVTRDSSTQLSVTLIGQATSHASANNVANLGFTFQAGAFAAASPNQVVGYQKSDLKIVFGNETGFFNVMPYAESFETYTNGTPLHGTNGWTATYGAAAASVTNSSVVTSNLLTYLQDHTAFPISGTHTQVLSVDSTVQSEIHSEAASRVYVEFMMFPAPLEGDPPTSTNLQSAFYISTNNQLVIWHYNLAGASNEWLTLASVSSIDTSRWMRLTMVQDYTHSLFQIRVNQGLPATDAKGWTAGGVSQPGSWFHMVQTNGSMSGFSMAGGGDLFLDDLTVKATLPGWMNDAGSVYLIR